MISIWHKNVRVAVYVVVGFLTFGHVFNANYSEPKECAEPSGTAAWLDCRSDARRSADTFGIGYMSAMAGIAWPVYWGARLALVVTK